METRPARGRRGRRARRLRGRRAPRRSSRSAPRPTEVDPPARGARSRAAEDAGFIGADALGTGREHPRRGPARPGRLRGRRGDRPAAALEDKRAQPDQRPPYPAERGLWGKPTVVNNVETLAAVPWIVANGAEALRRDRRDRRARARRSSSSRGAVGEPGIAEVPLGTPLRELRRRSPAASSGTLKAVLVGGPSGGFLPADALDTPYDVRRARARRARIVGSGSSSSRTTATCLVDLATLLTRYLADEACGKTIPCRIGTRRLARSATGIATGLPRPTDLQLLADLAADIRDAALCGLERLATHPAADRDAILPERVRRPHPPQHLPSRRLPARSPSRPARCS